jgi:hypothetical protein
MKKGDAHSSHNHHHYRPAGNIAHPPIIGVSELFQSRAELGHTGPDLHREGNSGTTVKTLSRLQRRSLRCLRSINGAEATLDRSAEALR